MFVRTDRLLLRPGWIEDASALARALGDEAIARSTTRIPWPYSLADAESYLAMQRDPHSLDCLVFARTSGAPRLVGSVAISDSVGGYELGYWIARPFWGLGFATEAADALLRAAHESLRIERIQSSHFTDNPASGHVLRKLGFRPTGTIVRRHSLARGHDVDCLLFDDGDDSCEEPAMRCLEAA